MPETIKPSSPTPSHLKLYPLSFIDNIYFSNYVPLLYFYNPNKSIDQNSKISQLRKSLSQLLSKYYHFAGRIKDKTTIECNDQGVLFLVTKVKNKLSVIRQNPTEKLLNPLFPDELQWKEMDWSASFIAIQINWFACGGMVISICISHKLGDAATIFNFMNDWAIINQKFEEDEKDLVVSPLSLLDVGATIFPQRDLPIFPEMVLKRENNVEFKRFVFQPAMIKSLKAMVTSSSMHSPTRVQVVSVTAWIYKHAVSIMGLNFQTALFCMAVDLRKRMDPPLSEKCVGNMVWFSSMMTNKNEMELEDLVYKIKEGLSECCEVYPKMFREIGKNNLLISECLKQATEPQPENTNVFGFSSWCRFPMYEADFGWGKPIWITTTGCSSRNYIGLMDTKDGDGIEALVNMEEKYMAKFEHEFKLLQYSSRNPNNVGYDDCVLHSSPRVSTVFL